jgi:hypothetical protein
MRKQRWSRSSRLVRGAAAIVICGGLGLALGACESASGDGLNVVYNSTASGSYMVMVQASPGTSCNFDITLNAASFDPFGVGAGPAAPVEATGSAAAGSNGWAVFTHTFAETGDGAWTVSCGADSLAGSF